MKNKKILLFSALFCLVFSVNAQKNYQPGYVVLMSGETLKGFVDYRNWERNPEVVNFKTNEAGAENSYSVNDIKAFEITGKDHYLRADVVKDMLPVNTNLLEMEGVQKMVNATVFLRSIVRSEKLSLYELVDDKAHYFIQQAGGDFEELIFRIYLRKDDRNISVRREIYKDQLKRFALNDDATRKIIDKASYEERDLTTVVRRLNGNTNDEKQNTGSPVRKTRFFAGAGISMNKIDFQGSKTDLTVLNENFTPGISVGGGIDLLSKRDFQSLFIRFMLRYHTMSYKGEAITSGPLTNQIQKNQYDLKMNMINPAVYVFYTVLKNQAGKLHFGVGAGYNITSYPTNRYTKTDQNTGEVTTQDNYLDLGSWIDVHGKVGYVIKNSFEIELDTRISGGFTSFHQTSSKARSYTLSIHRYF